MKKKVLVIGGAGFLGNNLCHYLVKRNYEVYCFDLVNPLCQSDIHYIRGDFFDDTDLKKSIADKDCVVHAVSTVNPGNSNVTYMQGYQKDFFQTIKLCDMLRDTGTKLIFISSGGTVYGNHIEQPINENVLPHPINHYGNIKLSIENAMRAFNYQMHTNYVIARVSNPYGKGQDYHKGVGFIDAALKNTINKIPIEIWGDGQNIRDYIYIEDVCEMLCALIEYKGNEDTFNISSGIGTSQNQVVDIIKEMGYFPTVIYKEKRSVDVRKIILDNKRIQEICNIKLVGLQEGIKKYSQYLEGYIDGVC